MSSSPASNEATPSVKLKENLLFTNQSNEIKTIASLQSFAYFWTNLELWIRAMLVECPEESHEEWYKTWKGYERFDFGNPQTPASLITVCIMENTRDEFNVLQVLDQLVRVIPYLGNHIFYTSGDTEDTSTVVKLMMFQHFEFQNPYVTFNDPENTFNNLNVEESEDQSPHEKPIASTTEENNSSANSISNSNQLDETVDDQSPNQQKSDIDRSDMDDFDETGSSLLSYGTPPNQQTARNKRKQQTIRSMIQSTCKEEISSMQTAIISEVKKVIFEHLKTPPPTPPIERANSTPLNHDTDEDTPVAQNNNVSQQQLVTISTTAPPLQHQSQLPPIPERDSSTSHQQSVPVQTAKPTSSTAGTTRHQSKYPRKSSTPPVTHQKWNSAWKHKSNPNYSAKNTSKASTVENPYTSTRPPAQVQFTNPTATPIGPTAASTPATPIGPTASSTSNYSRSQGFVPVSSSTNPPPQFTPSQQQFQQQTPFSTQHQTPSFHQQQPPHHPSHPQPIPPSNPHHHSSVPTMNFNYPTANPSSVSQNHGNYVKGGSVQFIYNGLTYELRDTDFTKYSGDLMDVNTTDDIIHFYKQLRALAVQRNIFVQDFDQLTVWDRVTQPLPPTCIFTSLSTVDNTEVAYQRMRSVLYQKIMKATFARPEHQAIVMNYSITQDGFALLYDLAARCHPHILEKSSRYNRFNARPQMTSDDNIYTLKRKYETWLELEQVSRRVYTDECVLRYIMKDLEDDNRYEKALQHLRVDLSTHETMKRHSSNWVPFPVELMLHNLPQTVMSCYDDDEKDSLFSDATISKMSSATSDTDTSNSSNVIEEGFVRTVFDTGENEDVQAFINVMKRSDRLPKRESIDALCKGCGRYGHDIFHQGCDFCAQLSIALKFLEKNPQEIRRVIKEYMNHQKQRQTKRNEPDEKQRNNQKFYRKKSMKATVKTLSNAIQSALNEIVDNEHSDGKDDDVFEDAPDQHSDTDATESNN